MAKVTSKFDRKFLIFIGCLVLIPFLLVIFLILAQGCSSKKITYSKYEEMMRDAAKNYLVSVDQVPEEKGDYIIVQLTTLVDKKYIGSPKSKLNDSTCDGSVIARKSGDTVNYIPSLKCGEYGTSTLKESILKDLTTDSDGLYETATNYVYRGLALNNFIKIGGVDYRIISMDKNGIVKLYNRVSEEEEMFWDSKYNIDTKDSTGINKFSDSYILEVLRRTYKNDKRFKNAKSIMVPMDICVYSKQRSDRTIDKSNCVEVIEKQYISLLDLDDYMNASLDPNCVDLYSKSCANYNYLERVTGVNTWTKDVVSTNSYQAYRIVDGIVHAEDTDSYETYNLVIYIDGNELISSGNGSKKDPYTIKKY